MALLLWSDDRLQQFNLRTNFLHRSLSLPQKLCGPPYPQIP